MHVRSSSLLSDYFIMPANTIHYRARRQAPASGGLEPQLESKPSEAHCCSSGPNWCDTTPLPLERLKRAQGEDEPLFQAALCSGSYEPLYRRQFWEARAATHAEMHRAAFLKGG